MIRLTTKSTLSINNYNRSKLSCFRQFCVKLVNVAGSKMRIRKIGLMNFMVILVIFLYTITCNYTSYNKEKYRKTNIIIIHKKINLNDLFTVPGLAEMEIGLDLSSINSQPQPL